VHDNKLDRSVVKHDIAPRKGNNGKTRVAASLNLPDWYAKAELSVSAAQRPSAKPKSEQIENTWTLRKIRGF
jgi:hypothetical protein